MTFDQPPRAWGHVLIMSQSVLAFLLVLVGGLLVFHFRERGRGAPTRFGLTALCLGMIGLMLWLAIGILTRGPIVQVDAQTASLLFAHRAAWLDQVMMLISALGDGSARTVGTIALAAYLLWRRKVRWALALAAVMVAAAVLTPTLKTIFHFARPSLLYSGADAFSFPSGHATSAAALYIVLAWIAARSLSGGWKATPWILAVALVGLTGLSRVYVGAHWLSDVLAGFALGGALGVAGVLMAAGGKRDIHPMDGRRDGLAILAILIVVGVALGPTAFAKARHLYAPYLAHPMEKVLDPGLSEPTGAPIASPARAGPSTRRFHLLANRVRLAA